jgi:hypothetical protein
MVLKKRHLRAVAMNGNLNQQNLGSFPFLKKPRRSSVLFHKSSLLFLIICVCGIGSSASFADDFFSKAIALYDNGQFKKQSLLSGRQLMKGDTNLLRGLI